MVVAASDAFALSAHGSVSQQLMPGG